MYDENQDDDDDDDDEMMQRWWLLWLLYILLILILHAQRFRLKLATPADMEYAVECTILDENLKEQQDENEEE